MKSIAIAAMIFAVAWAAAANEKKANELIQAAQAKETIQGDLKGAIASYGQAVQEAGANRGLAAMALVRMAECYQKMGDAEARKIFEQIVREYGDQKEAVAAARARLGATEQMPRRQTITLAWSGSKDVRAARVSPDGRFIVFTDWSTGDLAVHDIAAGTDRHLTNKGTWKESQDHADPGLNAISKDNRRVAYTWYNSKEKRPELRIGNLVGAFDPRTVYHIPEKEWIRPHDWSPDGSSLAVVVITPGGIRQIGLISVADGSLRILKTLDIYGVAGTFFSPDGKYLGYDYPQSDSGVEKDIVVLSVDGVREIRPAAHAGINHMMGWSPDGKWLLFMSDRNGSMSLWGVRFADGKPQGAPELLRENMPAAPSVDPAGITQSGALYYSIEGGQDRYRIQIADFDFATGKLSHAKDLSQDYLESDADAGWSQDGRQLVYKSLRGPGPVATHEVIVIRQMETGQNRELYPKLAGSGPWRWSPDGRSFITAGYDLQRRQGIFRIDAQAGDVSTLLLTRPGETSWFPAWAPDGKSFYFMREYSKTKDFAYIRVDLATGKETELIRRRVLAQVYPSPDGQYIVSHGIDEATNSRTLLLIPTDGGDPRELMRYPSGVSPQDLADTSKGAWVMRGAWAPDSRSFIAYKARGPFKGIQYVDAEVVWRVPIDGGKPQKLDIDSTVRGLAPIMLAVHPDGKHAAVQQVETAPQRDPEVWAVENFVPAVSAKMQ